LLTRFLQRGRIDLDSFPHHRVAVRVGLLSNKLKRRNLVTDSRVQLLGITQGNTLVKIELHNFNTASFRLNAPFHNPWWREIIWLSPV
jgi:hypothetical protein